MTHDHLLPEWAQPFRNAEAANNYWDMVCEIATIRWGDQCTLNYLAGTLEMPNGAYLNIANVAIATAGSNPQSQRRGLYNFFASFDQFKPGELEQQMNDWEWVRPRLRIRLQRSWNPGWELLARSIDAQTDLVVALDHDLGSMPLAASKIDKWPVSKAEVWRVATEASAGQGGIERFDLVETYPKIICFDGGMFTSGIVMDLGGRLQHPVGELGALVSCPTAHITYVSPIRTLVNVQDAVARMLTLSVLCQQSEPNPITTSVFWYRSPGRLEPGVAFTGKNRLDIRFSEPLRSILDQAA